MRNRIPPDATPQEWRKHLHKVRYERRLSSQRLWSIALLIAATAVLLAGFALAGATAQ